MVYRSIKSFTIIGSCFAFSLWWFGAQNFSVENFYPKDEFCQDVSKIYHDMGNHALTKRQDLQAAVKSYLSALNVKPDNFETYEQLCRCYEQLGEKEKVVKIYLKLKELNPTFIKKNRYFKNFKMPV